jgi:Xaa-Pro aminopeptidase
MKYTAANQRLYIENRKNFSSKLKPGSMAIFHSADEFPRSGDQNFKFKQNADTFYLSGIDQEETVLLLFPDCPYKQFREVLFLKKTNEFIKIWEGHKYTKEEGEAASGIKTVLWMDELDKILNMLMLKAENVYLSSNDNDRYVNTAQYRDLRKGLELKQRYPAHTYHRSAPILAQLRMIKSEEEIKQLQTACDITDKAFRRVLQFVKPGVWEHEIEAEIIYEFIRNGATGHAYEPIIASGVNAICLHYNDNNSECKDGEVILFDFGAEYGNYNADLSRSIPVNGRFTPRQKEVYKAVRKVQVEAMKLLVPGNDWETYHKQVGELMTKELLDIKLLSKADVDKQDPKWPAYKKYFMHGTSHHIGLDVHDIANRHQKFEAGMVFTCEPGIYIAEENLGIRLENDMVITKNGPVRDLMAKIPIELEEIEDLMNA